MTSSDERNRSYATAHQMFGDFQPDQILGGRYRVISMLGRGGMGIVYKVEQIFLGKELALKTILKGEKSENILRRFQAEARAVFSLHHPNIITVHDFGLLDDDTPFMAMEIVTGKTLGDRLKEGPLSVDEAIPLFIQICFGLAHAHESGIIHRDIKPNNIMVLDDISWGTEGSIKILDFGIAKLTQHEGGEIQALTRTGEIFGSPFYMSPEQCMGTKIDHRSDIYSLGCVLFESLTGKPPFVGDNAMNTMLMHQRTECPKLQDSITQIGKLQDPATHHKTHKTNFPPALEEIVQTLLTKNPDDRYQSLGLAAHDLAALRRGEKSNIGAVVNVARPARTPAIAPDTVKIKKSSFILMLAATAVLFSSGTAKLSLYLHTIKPVSTKTHKSKASDPFAEPNMPAVDKPRGAYKYVASLGDPTDHAGSETKSNHEKAEKDILESTLAEEIQNHSPIFFATDYPTDKTLEQFKGYKDAQFIELSNCKVTDAGFKNLRESKILRLVVSGDKDIKSVDEISQLRYLQRLNMTDTGIIDSAMTKLADLPMLDQLDISGCNITEKGLLELTKSTSLTQVQLSEKKYDRKFIASLQEKLPQCIFRNYFSKANVEVQTPLTLNDLDRLKMKYSIVSRANPLSRYAARYSIEMVPHYYAQDNRKQEWELLQRAKKICNQRKDWEVLADVLTLESQYLKLYGDKNEALKVKEHAIKLLLDTNMHDHDTLPEKLGDAINLARGMNRPDKAIKFAEAGLQLIDQFPDQNQDYLPFFCELLAWSYYEMGVPVKGQKYAKRNLEYWQVHKSDNLSPDEINVRNNFPMQQYIRALIEMGHAMPTPKEQLTYYNQALDLEDKLHGPEELNLVEHYCDACLHIASFYDSEGKRVEALRYLRRAQSALNHMKHSDVFNRKKIFAERIAALRRPK
ncbi:MAG: protein kinase [Candidatus Obscuribacterales bacterium]